MSIRDTEFRRLYLEYRVADQAQYYAKMRDEYDAARKQAITVRNVLLWLAAVCGAVGPLVTATGRVVLGISAALLAAFAGAVTAFQSLIGFDVLRKLYGDAALNLDSARVGWGTSDDLASDVDRVEAVFESEIGQWGQLRVGAEEPAGPGDAASGVIDVSDRREAPSEVGGGAGRDVDPA